MRKFTLLLLTLLILPGNVCAVKLKSYQIIAEIEDATVKEDFLITLLNDANTSLHSAVVSAPPDSEIISVRDSYGDLEYKALKERTLKINFNFTTPVKPGEERLIFIDLRTKSLISKKDGYFEYLLVFTPVQDIQLEHVLKLPSNAKLYSPGESFKMVVPEAELDKEYETPTIVWKLELEANRPEVFLVRFKSATEDVLKDVAFVLLLVIIASILGFTTRGAWKRYRKIRTIKSLKILNERERRVVEEIVKNEGIKQFELLEKLEYKKSSLSKILTKLEGRGIIKKKKVGKVNKWYLGEKID